jgi:hypothetical protein
MMLLSGVYGASEVCNGADAKRAFFRGLLPTSRASASNHNVNIISIIDWGKLMTDFNRQVVAAEADVESESVVFKVSLVDPIEVKKAETNCKDVEAFKKCANVLRSQ